MQNLQVENALETINELIPLVEQAENQFKSARNWSFLDVLGGDFIVDIVKHYKLNKVAGTMNEVDYLLQKLGRELGNINIPEDYRMQLGGFLTFADFFFDGFFVDAYVASKIMNSLEQVQQLKNKLYILRSRLESM